MAVSARDLGVAAVAVPLLAALALAIGAWPVTTTLVMAVATVLALAWRRPELGLAAGVLLVGLEGSIKLLLRLEPTPIPADARAVGAFAVDVALFAAVAGVLAADRLRAPKELWGATSRAERAVLVLLGGWLALSVLQVVLGGELVRGLRGFRLFQAYALVAVAAFAVARRRRPEEVAAATLAIGAVVAGYAALRIAIGPAQSEAAFAVSVETTVAYGGAIRAIGSFSSAVGLGSYLTPVAVFGIVAGLLWPRLRVAGWAVAGLAIVAVLGTFGRGPIAAIACGLVFAVVVMAVAGKLSRRRKLAAAALVACALGATYGGVLIAATASPKLQARAEGLTDPLGDDSVQERIDNWEATVREAGDRPFGSGVGAVGTLSAPGRPLRTTDNSFLKVLVEQGFLGAAMFVLGLLGAIVLIARCLARAAAERRAVGLAALAGLVGFLVAAGSAEYVEQPGKVVAWSLLGFAAACALPPRADEAPG